jgi:methyl-accepting chemotaxis protein
MITGLRNLISQIQESSNQIHSRANEMASLSRTSSEAISQMASNVSQISVSITKISDTTQTVATVAQKAARTAETGDENISGVIAKVSHSKDNAYQSAELIKNLGKRSMQIGEIINYITKVADQTNLLSLNAAIEAARAGEAGRGFAVVADEVRKLAEGSAQSASEIARLISEVQAETAKAVAAVEVVAKDVGESATVTQEAGKSFKDISQAAKNIAGQIEDIAASSEETAASAEEASASSEEQVATFEEISTSIENLKEIAEGLKDSASKFKLS